MKKEIGILFNGDMVRAILEGRKTQTRRVVKTQPPSEDRRWSLGTIMETTGKRSEVGRHQWIDIDDPARLITSSFTSPAKPGDLLYVRERIYSDSLGGARYHADSERARINGELPADDGIWDWDSFSETRPGIPSIHMPKTASRIWLEVESVRVERLQDISEEDAKSEGLAEITKDGTMYKFGIAAPDGLPAGSGEPGWHWDEFEATATGAFAKLWQSVYGDENWDSNPFVWVVTFKVLSTTGRPQIAQEGAES